MAQGNATTVSARCRTQDHAARQSPLAGSKTKPWAKLYIRGKTVAKMSSVTRAILLSLIALLFFDLMGLIIKRLSVDYNAAELSAYRNIFGLIPSVIALRYSEFWHQENRSFRIRQWPMACMRGLIVTLAQLMFYLSLGRIAFATATTISYSNALFMTIFAIVLLGERVGVIRWAAVLVGFAGVMMVTGLGKDTFSWDAVLPIAAAALYAMSGVTARLMDTDVPSAVVNMYSTVFAVLGSLVIALVFDGFSPVQSGTDVLWIVTMGTCGGTAVIFLIMSFRMTEQSNLAPFTYFGIPLAIVLGWLFFDEAPLDDLFPGSLLIAAGGLLVIWRERRLKSHSSGDS